MEYNNDARNDRQVGYANTSIFHLSPTVLDRENESPSRQKEEEKKRGGAEMKRKSFTHARQRGCHLDK